MTRKNYFTFLFSAVLILVGSGAAFAQATSGSVILVKADGTTEPVANATVEPLRTDVKGNGAAVTTNEKGEFSITGLQSGTAVYALVVSAPNIGPNLIPNVQAGRSGITIKVSPGNGQKWTEEQAREAVATLSKPLTEAEKKKLDEEYKKIEAKNKNIENLNVVIKKSLDEGNAAFNSKNYDLAITKYDEGITASPDYVGSAPVLLNNKANALTNRAVGFYNQGVKSTDAAAKTDNYTKAKNDFSAALDALDASWKVMKNAPADDLAKETNLEAKKTNTLTGFADLITYMVRTERVDTAKMPIVEALSTEFNASKIETAKKAQTQIGVAELYRISGNSDKAVAEYKKALVTSPDNPDALAGLGLSLVNMGYNEDATINQAVMQEAINYLQRFTEVAPSNHKFKDEVGGMVTTLKGLNVKPEKTGGKKKN